MTARTAGVLLLMLALAASGAPATAVSPARDSAPAWYCQIGAWHLEPGSGARKPCLFHDAALDGARSGQATAIVKYNLRFTRLRSLAGHFTLANTPAGAGFFVKDKGLAYYFLVERSSEGDSVRCVRREGTAESTVAVFGARVPDTVALALRIDGNTLTLSMGTWSRSIPRPADLPQSAIIGFACNSGAVRVWRVSATAEDRVLDESFNEARVINLHLDRMFSSGKPPAGR